MVDNASPVNKKEKSIKSLFFLITNKKKTYFFLTFVQLSRYAASKYLVCSLILQINETNMFFSNNNVRYKPKYRHHRPSYRHPNAGGVSSSIGKANSLIEKLPSFLVTGFIDHILAN